MVFNEIPAKPWGIEIYRVLIFGNVALPQGNVFGTDGLGGGPVPAHSGLAASGLGPRGFVHPPGRGGFVGH